MSATQRPLPVVVVSFNTRELLRRCLSALMCSESVSPLPIVVDNASADGSTQLVRDEFPAVQVIALRANCGFAAANNVALRALGFTGAAPCASHVLPGGPGTPPGAESDDGASTQLPEHVLLLNPDTEVQPDALATLLRLLQARPRAGVVGAQLLFPDGRLQQSAFRFPGIRQTFLDFVPLHPRLLNSRANGRYPQHDQPFEIDHPLGACMLVRGQAISQVGLLDESYFMYVEEVDWCRRIKRAGWQVWCEPHARIVHQEAQATRQFHHAMYLEKWRSRLRYYRKFHSPLYVALLRMTIRFGLWSERRKLESERVTNGERTQRLDTLARVRALL